MAKLSVKIILLAWIILWAIFLIRPLVKKDLIRDYSNLSKLSTEGKRAYVTGPRLYEFIMVCNETMPKPSTYAAVGIEKNSLEYRRVVYYLYPNVENEDPQYILDLNKYTIRKVK